MKKNKLIIVLVLILGVTAISGVVYWGYNDYLKNITIKDSSRIKDADIYTVPEAQNILFEGEFKSIQKLIYQPESTNGVVDKIYVENNQQIKKGDLLFTYKNDQLLQQVDELNYQLGTLKDKYEKLQNQYNITSEENSDKKILETIQEQLDDSKRQQVRLTKQIETLKSKSCLEVKAPFNGIVKIPNSNITKAIVTLEDPNFEIVCNVGEKDILKVNENEEVSINIYGTGQSIKGKIKSIDSEPTEIGLTPTNVEQGEASVGNNNNFYKVLIEPGSQVDAYLGFHVQVKAKAEKDVIKVPKTSIFKENDVSYVWNINDGILKKNIIHTADWNDKYVQVEDGITFGDKIIRESNNEMKEGDRVNGVNKN